jgi:putative tryptophan/tyrosine transport system substrate-binding protein
MAGIGATVTLPLAVRAQQPPVPTIGYLAAGTLEKTRDIVTGVHRGLAETGYVEGRNLAVEYRWAEYDLDRLAALAADLVRRQVALIIAFALPPAAKAISQSIPIVFFAGFDPVKVGLIDSLNRPGGNMTGVSVRNIEGIGKRLEILHELVPAAKVIAYLGGSPLTAEPEARELSVAAGVLGLRLLVLSASDPNEFASAFERLAREKAEGLVVGSDAALQRNSDQLAALAARHKIPAIYASRISTAGGGLMSYGTYYADGYRIVGNYAGRILSDEKPADLPVQQVTKVELVINLKTAKASGFDVPPALLARADEVIE